MAPLAPEHHPNGITRSQVGSVSPSGVSTPLPLLCCCGSFFQLGRAALSSTGGGCLWSPAPFSKMWWAHVTPGHQAERNSWPERTSASHETRCWHKPSPTGTAHQNTNQLKRGSAHPTLSPRHVATTAGAVAKHARQTWGCSTGTDTYTQREKMVGKGRNQAVAAYRPSIKLKISLSLPALLEQRSWSPWGAIFISDVRKVKVMVHWKQEWKGQVWKH